MAGRLAEQLGARGVGRLGFGVWDLTVLNRNYRTLLEEGGTSRAIPFLPFAELGFLNPCCEKGSHSFVRRALCGT